MTTACPTATGAARRRGRRPGRSSTTWGSGRTWATAAGTSKNAVAFLGRCGRVLKRSAVYETTPQGMPGAGLFYNQVLALATPLQPLELLARCKEHEASQGRDPEHSHYRDRAIDIDILLAGDRVIATPELAVPHPRLAERGFALVPLFEIAPKLVHPLEKVTVARLLSRLPGGERIRRLD